MERKMIWVEETNYSGWACSSCGWIFPNPAPNGTDLSPIDDDQAKRAYEDKARSEFEEHYCGRHPSAATQATHF
jgi:hypothetical protein